MKRALVASASLLLACSSYRTAPPNNPVAEAAATVPDGLARVCVARTSRLALAVAIPTYDNGTLVGATKGPTHFCYFAAPGHHDLVMVADDEATASLDAEAGRTYTLEQGIDFIFGYVRVRPRWVSAERARELLGDSDYEVLTSVPGDEKLPDPGTIARAK